MPSAPHIPPTFVAGYDGSEGATAAVRWAVARTAPGGRLVVVYAVDPGTPAPMLATREDRAHAALKTLWMEEDSLIDADVELLVADEAPAEALCRAAATVRADGIVVGPHHPGPFNADTVRHLLSIADRPVTVVPS